MREDPSDVAHVRTPRLRIRWIRSCHRRKKVATLYAHRKQILAPHDNSALAAR